MGVLERRLQELGRIRIGDQVALKGGNGSRPRRLEAFRLTSQNKPRLECAARLWGGTVQEWPGAPMGKQWELYTEVASLPVVVPPFHAFSQANEIWQGGECRVRCDGETIAYSIKVESIGQPCHCATMSLKERLELAKDGKACDTVTRLSLILPDVPGVGVWRFDTGSFYAGMELQGAAELLEQASADGAYIECTLALETRQVRRRSAAGKVQTQVFPVVTLQPNITMRELMTRQVPSGAMLGQPARPALLEGRPAAVEELWPDETPRALPAHDLPDDGWRNALRALLPQLEGHLAHAEAVKALADAQATPGYGSHLLSQALDMVAALEEGQG